MEPYHAMLETLGLDLYTTPAPSSGPLLAFIMNVIEIFGTPDTKPFSEWSLENQILALQRIVETFKHAYAKRTLMGDPKYLTNNTQFLDLMANFTNEGYAGFIREKIFDNQTFNDPDYYGAELFVPDDHGTAQVSVIAPNGDAVSVTSTINL
jgi:gamma-glutamyltranspeptidase/glutathione hydrolase/leukotriene-C4 hydrolase